jgi:hypothetical protein
VNIALTLVMHVTDQTGLLVGVLGSTEDFTTVVSVNIIPIADDQLRATSVRLLRVDSQYVSSNSLRGLCQLCYDRDLVPLHPGAQILAKLNIGTRSIKKMQTGESRFLWMEAFGDLDGERYYIFGLILKLVGALTQRYMISGEAAVVHSSQSLFCGLRHNCSSEKKKNRKDSHESVTCIRHFREVGLALCPRKQQQAGTRQSEVAP